MDTTQKIVDYFLRSGVILAAVDGDIIIEESSVRRAVNEEEQTLIDENKEDLVNLLQKPIDPDLDPEKERARTTSTTGVTGFVPPSISRQPRNRSSGETTGYFEFDEFIQDVVVIRPLVSSFNCVTGDVEGINSVNSITGDVEVVSTFNGHTGDVTGVSAFNGSTGAVEGVSSFNGATGAVVGVSSFNGATGVISGVSSVNGQTGSVTISTGSTEVVSSINGSTGALEAVTSVNGSTGAITNVAVTNSNNVFTTTQGFSAGITIGNVNGITFADNTNQRSASRNGFLYTAGPYPSGAGTFSITLNASSGGRDTISFHTTDADGNDRSELFQLLMNNGGYLSVSSGDFSYLLVTTLPADPVYDGSVSIGEYETIMSGSYFTFQGDFELEATDVNSGKFYVTIIPNHQGPSTFNGLTAASGVSSVNGATGAVEVVSSINGATGVVEAVNTVNGATGAIAAVNSINGATGAVEAVSTFNGATGAVSTTSLTLQVAGISSSGDITSHGGTSEANNFVVDGGKIFQKGNASSTHIDMSSAQDITIKAGDDINLNPDGQSSFVFRNDGTNITVGRIFGGGDGRFISVNDDMAQIDIGDLDTVSTNSKITLSDNGIILFDEGGTQREVIDTSYRRNTDVATFTIDASSAIATGAKTNSLYRIPYNATLKTLM